MTTEIDVRGAMSRTGLLHSDLVTRPTGRAVRTSIEAELRATIGVHVVILDFSAIRLIDCSCADEILARLVQDTSTVFIVRGLADHHVDPVEQVLEHQSLALVTEQDGTLGLLGTVAEQARTAFARLIALGGAGVEELALDLAWSVEEAAAALDDLAGRRLVVRSAGRFHPPTAA